MKYTLPPVLIGQCLLLLLEIPVATAQNQFDVLVYTRDDNYHRNDIPVAIDAFQEMARKHQFGLTWTQDTGIFTSQELAEFEVVVFFRGGDVFTEEQRAGLLKYINEGGGFVGIHAASITNGQWPWYDELVGRNFTGHPSIQSGVIQVVDLKFPAAVHLHSSWIWTDEWYNFGEDKSNNLKTILTVDESTYDVTAGFEEPMEGMGVFHPISWYQEFDGGRSFYHALGHKPEAYLDQKNLDFIYGGIFWAATGRGVSTIK